MSWRRFFAKPDDEAMDAAFLRARSTFKYLWRELTWEYRRIMPALELAAVKAGFSDEEDGGGQVEYMWVGELEFNGDTITGILMNGPNHLTSVQEGDRVTLSLDDVHDWMYVLSGRVYGGFTVDVIRAGMSARERRRHDEAWGFEFGQPGDVQLTPQWGASTDPDLEHPMSESMAEELAEAIDADPEGFAAPNEEGLTTLHSMALGGSAACVRVLLEKGADPLLRTRSGKTARDFAEQMGWPRVKALLEKAERQKRQAGESDR
jgi:uncharacterized protein YegJ (DUF2314 family)